MSETSHFEQFKEIFDAYFSKWWKVVGVLMLLVYLLAFGLYTIGILNKHLDIALPSFLRAIVTFEYWSWMNDMVVEAIGIGFIAVGAISVGVVAIGACSVGVVSMGACSVGIVAVGAFSIGIFAFGGNSFGSSLSGQAQVMGTKSVQGDGLTSVERLGSSPSVLKPTVSTRYPTRAEVSIRSRQTAKMPTRSRYLHGGCQSSRKYCLPLPRVAFGT